MLEVKGITKTYEGKPLLKGVSFEVDAGETVCLLGPSGSGKSTLLRIISGLEQQENGEVLWDGTDISKVPVHRRNFGLMFQDYALFPHRTVAENVAFGLRMQNLPREEIKARVLEALTQVNLQDFSERSVTDLSGGEQQRVALARALAPRPGLLMLDEPLGALDRALREQLTEELRTLLQRTEIPAVYVTHDQDEAYTIADRLILLHEGVVIQSGAPADVYAHPRTSWVARFLGLNNILPGQVVSVQPFQVQTPLGNVALEKPSEIDFQEGQSVHLLLRPTRARILRERSSACNCFPAVVEDVVFHGETYHVVLSFAPDYHFQFSMENPPELGTQVTCAFEPDSILCMEQ